MDKPLGAQGRELRLRKDESSAVYYWGCSACRWTFAFTDGGDHEPTPARAMFEFNNHRCQDHPKAAEVHHPRRPPPEGLTAPDQHHPLKIPPKATGSLSEKRILTPFFQEDSTFLGWRCSNCSWSMSKPADCPRRSFHALLADFDQHDCNAFKVAV
jgi:ribosomal protein L37AE/L43A